MVKKEDIIKVLKKVQDPELRIDIWTLGLVYKVEVKDNKVFIEMTFTSPMCPYGPILVENIKDAVKKVNGVKDVDIDIVFEPLWEPSDELKAMLGIL